MISPAAFFFAALIVRNVTSSHDEPARTAQQVVMWYAGRIWTLWLLLLALPFGALVTGCAALQQNWGYHGSATQFARQTFVITLATVAAAGIIGVVLLHMLSN